MSGQLAAGGDWWGGGVPGHEGEDEHPAVLGEEVRQERAQVLHLGRRLPHAVFPCPRPHDTHLVSSRVVCVVCRVCRVSCVVSFRALVRTQVEVVGGGDLLARGHHLVDRKVRIEPEVLLHLAQRTIELRLQHTHTHHRTRTH
jgi:hypothetical protein